MIKKALIIMLGIMLTSGCSSAHAVVPEKDVNVTGSTQSDVGEAVAKEIKGTVETMDIEPPDAFISGVKLRKSDYQWTETNGEGSLQSSTPVVLYELGCIDSVIDRASVGKEAAIETEGGKIISAKCYMDDANSKSCEIVGNTVKLSDDAVYNIYSVIIKYSKGECEYLFHTVDSSLKEDSAPMLRVMAGDLCYAMSLINYEWNMEDGAVIACGDTAYHVYKNGICPTVPLEGMTKVHISLPEGTEITNAYCYYSDEKFEKLPVEGGTIDIPDDPCGKAYGINVKFPEGSAEYVFGS